MENGKTIQINSCHYVYQDQIEKANKEWRMVKQYTLEQKHVYPEEKEAKDEWMFKNILNTQSAERVILRRLKKGPYG